LVTAFIIEFAICKYLGVADSVSISINLHKYAMAFILNINLISTSFHKCNRLKSTPIKTA